ncbi:helix-turn-helix transcriptional regulator [Lachnospiraceae bacterium NSJ-143]|nr:helix-turn-helix transcriptional regulator [Lachnospiraceae bacterium NSJ-143]
MSENIKENISKNIAKFRKKRGISQKELAEVVGAKNFTTVSSWERGISTPDADTILKLCKYFEISLYDLYDVENSDSGMTREQRDLFNLYNQLDEEGKEFIKKLIRLELERVKNFPDGPSKHSNSVKSPVTPYKVASYKGKGVEILEIPKSNREMAEEAYKKIRFKSHSSYLP